MQPIKVLIEQEDTGTTGEKSWGSTKDSYIVEEVSELFTQLQESVSQSIDADGKLTIQVHGTVSLSKRYGGGIGPVLKLDYSQNSQTTKGVTITLQTQVSPKK